MRKFEDPISLSLQKLILEELEFLERLREKGESNYSLELLQTRLLLQNLGLVEVDLVTRPLWQRLSRLGTSSVQTED